MITKRTIWRFLTASAFCLPALGVAHAQPGDAPPQGAQFQYASLTGLDGTIVVTRVPVLTVNGEVIYRDITLKFNLDADGNLILSEGQPVIVPSPSLQLSAFQAGRYAGPRNIANGKATVRVGGPGITGGGGSTWSLLAADDADSCTYPGSATWYVGPLDSNPQAERLKKAGITSTIWSYGVSGVGPRFSCFSDSLNSRNWENGSLIGVSQSGNTITIASFTYNGTDRNAPVDQITYILAP